MTTILLIISFILHLILLAAVYYLHQRLQELNAHRSQETELLLSRFLDEIRQENRQLQDQLKQSKTTHPEESSTDAPSDYSSPVPQGPTNTIPYSNTTIKKADFPAPTPIAKDDKVETSLESHVFQLYKEGLSPEEIAKRMNRGKTEIELLIKMQPHNF